VDATPVALPGATSTVPNMPENSPSALRSPWILHRYVHVPASSNVNDTGSPPGSTGSSVTFVPVALVGASGSYSQTSCTVLAVSGKCHVTLSPNFAVTALGVHVAGSASTSWFCGASASGSVADSVTSTGPSPSSACSVVGAVSSASPIVYVTSLTASSLPAASVERYSTVCSPSPSTVTGPRTVPASSESTRTSRKSTTSLALWFWRPM
jgi:hypothetical protein